MPTAFVDGNEYSDTDYQRWAAAKSADDHRAVVAELLSGREWPWNPIFVQAAMVHALLAVGAELAQIREAGDVERSEEPARRRRTRRRRR